MPEYETKSEKQKEQLEPKKPEKIFKAGGVVANVWKNQSEKGYFRVVEIQRAYKDNDGEFKHTHTMRLNDLPKLELVCREAYTYLLSQQQ